MSTREKLANEYKYSLNKLNSLASELNFTPSFEHSIEGFLENSRDWSLFHSISDIKRIFLEKRKNSSLSVKEIPLSKLEKWSTDTETGNISHDSNDFFIIQGIEVYSKKREVEKKWSQPILTQVGYDGGLLGIIRKRFDGIPHYLCEFKEEPGNYGKVQLSPTLQATFANLNQSHGGRKPHFAELFNDRNKNNNIKVLFDSWLAEDGGRLYLKRNKGILIEVDQDFDLKIPTEEFIWLSLYQIKQLLQEDAWINPHIRGILCHV